MLHVTTLEPSLEISSEKVAWEAWKTAYVYLYFKEDLKVVVSDCLLLVQYPLFWTYSLFYVPCVSSS